MIDNLPEYIKLRNAYNPAHYPANKKISAEEWNALWLSVMYQGNHQEDILASILNVTLPEVINVVNEQGVQIELYKEHIADEDIHLSEEQVLRIADVPNKQDKLDNSFITSNKTVVGAINHLETNRIAMQENLDNINATVDYLYSTDNVVYVSKQTGDDTEGNGSKNKPYKTVAKALTVVGSKLTEPNSRAAIEISDADIYYENIALPHRVYLLGNSATIVGQIAVGNQCYINISRHYASVNNQIMVSKQGTDMSLYVAYISDGRGIDGTLTGTTNLSNTTSSSILFAEINMVRVSANGFGCRDSANDWGHFHLDVSDFYLDTGAVGIYANSGNAYVVGTIDHILKMAGATDTKAIYMTGSTQVVALQCDEIKSDVAYEILLNPEDSTKGLFLNCLSVHGEKLGPGKPSKDASVFTNNYNELINTPTKVSAFENDSVFQSLTEVNSLISEHNNAVNNHSDIRAKLISNFTYNEVDKILSLIYADTSSKNITLPVSSDTKDGLMPSGTLGTISSIIERVTYLENSGVWKGTFDTIEDMPTHTPNPGFVGGSVNINDFIDISTDEDHGDQPTRYRIVGIAEGTGELTYQFVTILLATISLATNTTPGLFLGEDKDGKVSAESDGSGSVVGWDALKSRVSTLESNKVDKVIGYGLSQNDLTDVLKEQYDDAYSKAHEHSNKTLLDSYSQTEINLADAVIKKHIHDNKGILDLITESFNTELKSNYDAAYQHSLVGVTTNTTQTIAGLKTFTAPANIAGTEQATTWFNTANGGRIGFGKEGPNSGTGIFFEQVVGTRRLNFRGSASPGAIVWSQPEQGAQLYIDLGLVGSDYHRITMPASAGTLALTNQLPTKTSDLTNDSGFITESGINYLKDPDKTYLVIKTPADNDTFTLLTGTTGSPNYTIDWGDGKSETITTTTNPAHEYETAGMYLITISGAFENGIVFGSDVNENKDKIIEVYGGSNYPLSIENYAFYFCTALTTANFPNATGIIGDRAFYFCTALTTVNVPNVTSLSIQAFNFCTALTTANFPNVTGIGSFAFQNCTALTTANFPNVTGIGGLAFQNCTSLKELTLGNVTTTGTGTIFKGVKLVNLTIAQDVTDTDIGRITTFFKANGGAFTGNETKHGLQVEKTPTADLDAVRKVDLDALSDRTLLYGSAGAYDNSSGTKSLNNNISNYQYITIISKASGPQAIKSMTVAVADIIDVRNESSNYKWEINLSNDSVTRLLHLQFPSNTQVTINNTTSNAGLYKIYGHHT